MIFNSVLVRFTGEFGVKSPQTQELLESILRRNILSMLAEKDFSDLAQRLKIIMRSGRYYLAPKQPTEADIANLISVLGRTFGISSISPCFQAAVSDKTATRTVPAKLMLAHGLYPQNKKISIHVIGNASIDEKEWKGDILSLCEKFLQEDGSEISSKKKVSKTRFQATEKWDMTPWACVREKKLEIEVFENNAFISVERIKAPGGFPLGLEDPLVALVSGGFDSPVAAWMGLRRGAPLIFVIMDPQESAPAGSSVREKALRQVGILRQYMGGQKDVLIFVVPYGKVLETLGSFGGRVGLTCLLCKRAMYRVAEQIAHMYGAKGILTGEILGEQASQTAQNLMVLDHVATLPVHRPLFGFDKEEVVNLARQIGTAPIATISSSPCQGVPDHPQVRGDLRDVEDIEKRVGIDRLIQDSLDQMHPV